MPSTTASPFQAVPAVFTFGAPSATQSASRGPVAPARREFKRSRSSEPVWICTATARAARRRDSLARARVATSVLSACSCG
eukprot:6201063-Pyramimonas_sp.AAC.1